MDNLTPITREEMLMNDEPLTPITREEKILAGEDLSPVTRREYFLKKYRHAGGDVMVEGLSVTENGTYTAPEGKAYSPVEVAVPLPENAYLLKEASGSLVSFSDGADLPMPSFICNIDAVQDLHGYDAPWVGGAGKNKLDYDDNATGFFTSGLSAISINNYVISMTASASDMYIGNFNNAGGLFAKSPCKAGNSHKIIMSDNRISKNYVTFLDDSNNVVSASRVDLDSFTVPEGATKMGFRFGNGSAISGTTYTTTVMVVISTETDPTFAPYSNICPISGHTGVDAWVRGKNRLPMTVDGIKGANTDGTWTGNAYTLNGITYTILTDSDNNVIGIKANGTANATNTIFDLNPAGSLTIPANTTFSLSGCPEGGGGSTYRLYPRGGGSNTFDNGSGKLITLDSAITNPFRINVYNGAQVDNIIFYPMIVFTNTIDKDFVPYNPNSQTIQVSWQTEAGEVFGGYVDLVSGVLTVDRVGVTYSNTDRKRDDGSFRLYPVPSNALVTNVDNEQPSPLFICNKFKFMSIFEVITTSAVNVGIGISKTSSGFYIKDTAMLQMTLEEAKTYLSSHPIDVVYPLATPQTYQLTPTQIKSLLGNNNAWCDTGDVDIDYFAKEVTE